MKKYHFLFGLFLFTFSSLFGQVAPIISINNLADDDTISCIEKDFTISVVANDYANDLVYLNFQLENPIQNDFIALTYKDNNGIYQEILFDDGIGYIGNGRFRLIDADYHLLIKNNTQLLNQTVNYKIHLTKSNFEPLGDTIEQKIVLNNLHDANLSVDYFPTEINCVQQDFFFTSNSSCDGTMVKAKIQFSNPAHADSVTIEYQDDSWKYIPLTFNNDGTGYFGPESGFPFTNGQTFWFLISSNATEKISDVEITLSFFLADDATETAIFTPDTQSVDIVPVYPSIYSSLTNKKSITCQDEDFYIMISDQCMRGENIKIAIKLENPIFKDSLLFLSDDGSGNYTPLSFDNDGAIYIDTSSNETGIPLSSSFFHSLKIQNLAISNQEVPYNIFVVKANDSASWGDSIKRSVILDKYSKTSLTINNFPQNIGCSWSSYNIVTRSDCEKVKTRIKIAIDSISYNDSILIEYYNSDERKYLPLNLSDGAGYFGADTGFYYGNNTIQFRIKSNAYTRFDGLKIVTTVFDINDPSESPIIDQQEKTFNILSATPPYLTTDAEDSIFVKCSPNTDFNISPVVESCHQGKNVRVCIELADPSDKNSLTVYGEKIIFWTVTQFEKLNFDNNGKIYHTPPYPLLASDTMYRFQFNSISSHQKDIELSIYLVNGTKNEILSDIYTQRITVAGKPNPSFSFSKDSICQGDTVRLVIDTTNIVKPFVSNFTDNYYISYSINTDTSLLFNRTTIFNMEVTDGNGCYNSSAATDTVTVKEIPNITISGKSDVLAGKEYDYQTETGKYNYEWGVSNGNITDTENEATIVWDVSTGNGSVQVDYLEEINGCPAENPTIKNINIHDFNINDLNAVKAFLEQMSSDGINNNAYHIGIQDLDNWNPLLEDASIVWNDFGRITEIDWENKNLSGNLNLSACDSLQKLICNNNNIQDLNIPKFNILETILCENNQLKFSTLPLPNSQYSSYIYVPQDTIDGGFVSCIIGTSFLSSEYKISFNNTTVQSEFKWFYGNSNVSSLVFIDANGHLTFDKSLAGKALIGTIKNSLFPNTEIVVKVRLLVLPSIFGELSPCAGKEYIYTTDSEMNNYQWIIPTEGNILKQMQDSIWIMWEQFGNFDIKVLYDELDNTLSDTGSLAISAVICSAELNELTVTPGELSPNFLPEVYDYTFSLPCGESSFQMILNTTSLNANIIINDKVFGNSVDTSFALGSLGIDTIIIQVKQPDSEILTYTIKISKPFPDGIVVRVWDDVLSVINNPIHNGGYTFVSYQWHEDGLAIPNEINGNLHLYERPLSDIARYSVLLTTSDGIKAFSCPMMLKNKKTLSEPIMIYPNPAFDKVIVENANWKQEQKIQVYTTNGEFIREYSQKSAISTIDISSYTKGMYVFIIGDKQFKVVKQ
ncbi:T9SS type A sorting domain-containing protein [Bacteroidales bacterium OttesenSCG-928-C19]|nr:T9SS type A sorting domain-containing protein [Bacteroidales bacterium OttesenSCG-928-C19]